MSGIRNKHVLIELQLLPPLAYFVILLQADRVTLDIHSYFEKQSYRNRFEMPGPNHLQVLTVPIQHGGKIPFSEVEIDYRQPWLRNTLRTIETIYGNAPFFDYYWEEIKAVFRKKHVTLQVLSMELLTLCLRLIVMQPMLETSEKYMESPLENVIDIRSALHPKKPDNLARFYTPVPYFQLFGKQFAANMSILDLLLMTGPDSLRLIRASGGDNK